MQAFFIPPGPPHMSRTHARWLRRRSWMSRLAPHRREPQLRSVRASLLAGGPSQSTKAGMSICAGPCAPQSRGLALEPARPASARPSHAVPTNHTRPVVCAAWAALHPGQPATSDPEESNVLPPWLEHASSQPLAQAWRDCTGEACMSCGHPIPRPPTDWYQPPTGGRKGPGPKDHAACPPPEAPHRPRAKGRPTGQRPPSRRLGRSAPVL